MIAETAAQSLDTGLSDAATLLDQDTSAAKQTIAKSLTDARKRIVVVIDEVDRLFPDEIVQLFQIIKAVTDLPYVLYVIGFERTAVHSALTKAGIPSPDSYLDKIFQLQLTIPRASGPQLEAMIEDGLKTIGVELSELEGDDLTRWATAFSHNLREEFTTPRDVVRFLNLVRATLPPIRDEVNLADFLVLSALRTVNPQIDEIIQASRVLLVQKGEDNIEDLHVEHFLKQGEIPRFMPESLAKISAKQDNAIKELFPSATIASLSGDDRRRRVPGRICTARNFSTYFRFALRREMVPRRHVQILVDGPVEILREALRKDMATDTRTETDLMFQLQGFAAASRPDRCERLLEALLGLDSLLENQSLVILCGSSIREVKHSNPQALPNILQNGLNLEGCVATLVGIARRETNMEWGHEFKVVRERLWKVDLDWFVGLTLPDAALQILLSSDDKADGDLMQALLSDDRGFAFALGVAGQYQHLADYIGLVNTLFGDLAAAEERAARLLKTPPPWWNETFHDAMTYFADVYYKELKDRSIENRARTKQQIDSNERPIPVVHRDLRRNRHVNPRSYRDQFQCGHAVFHNRVATMAIGVQHLTRQKSNPRVLVNRDLKPTVPSVAW